MSIISYAQNFEDVMLYRALKDIEQGFYIDVGANDPEVDSVTKAFYDRGWRGINVEPVSEWYEKLQQQRPRDINLQVAVGAEKGEVALYEIPQTGLSTTDKNIADRHKRERGYEITTRQVPVRTLTEICSHYHVAPIHFLKIDVEGAEKSVLEGLDFNTIRPWIIVIESTLPNTQTEDYQAWEQQLLSAEYQFAYFDGLNRFYCANEHSDLIKRYQSPPNVFDGFQLAESVPFCGAVVTDKTQAIEQLQSKLELTEQHLTEQEQLLNTKQSELEQLQADKMQAIEQLQSKLEVTEQHLTEQEQLLNTKQSDLEQLQADKTQAITQLQSKLELAEQHLTKQEQLLNTKQSELEQLQADKMQAVEQLQSKLETTEKQLAENEQLLNTKIAELEQLQAHSHWLQSEWAAAKAKIDELNHSSHHWWTVADGLNQQLQAVYRSKSWRITWPLRKLMQLLKWLLRLPVRLLIGLIQLPKPMARWLLTKAITLVLKRNWLKQQAHKWLTRHPQLEAHLRAFARARGLIPTPVPLTVPTVEAGDSAIDETSGVTQQEQAVTANKDDFSMLTPRARQIYADLKTAMQKEVA